MPDPDRPTPPTLSQDARDVFDRALRKSVDALFDAPADVAASLIDQFLDGRLIFVLTRDALWSRPVEDAREPFVDIVRPPDNVDDDTPGNYL